MVTSPAPLRAHAVNDKATAAAAAAAQNVSFRSDSSGCRKGRARGKLKSQCGLAQYAPAFHTRVDTIVERGHNSRMEVKRARRLLCGFAAALERLLMARTAAELDGTWDELCLAETGWEALAVARRADTERLEPPLTQVDRRLLALLERARAFLDPHIVTFRIPELERLQHAAVAALVGARWGVAGLRTVIADTGAPLARRYFAFLALAERHPRGAWGLFAKYLYTPGAHHAFVGAAVEATRYYPGQAATLIGLFERIRGDQMLRRFLAPKILESLYVLGDPAAIPLYQELLITGHTEADPDRCEVTRALVAVRKLTGQTALSSKYPDPEAPAVRRALDEAERRFEETRDDLQPVVVI